MKLTKINKQEQKKFRDQIENLENALLQSNDKRVVKGYNSPLFPLKHYFVEGLYIREIFIKKGYYCIGKIHKYDHAWFLLKGKLLAIVDGKKKEINAPFFSTSSAGSKKVVHALEDCVFINIHSNPSNDKNISNIEKNTVSDNYKEYNNFLLSNTKNILKK
tara:strand:- start:3029 stop:3511 length:483 start_codon:yes stop_codon:yes gene_type:complete